MRGTRYGDFSRFKFDPAQGYTGVLAQQGRLQLDADWNDQREFTQHAIRAVLRDLLEGDWAPRANPGFGLRPVVALRFEGEDRLVIDESGTLAPGEQDPHTLELWLTWSGRPCMLVDCRAADGTLGYELAIEENGTLALALSVRERAASTLRLYSSMPLPVSKPVHLAVVVGADYVALVIDGRQVARSRHSGVPNLEAPVLVVGGRLADESWSAGFRGFIAAVRVWSVARTLAQLAEAGPVAPIAEWDTTDPGLLALWTFDAPTRAPLDDAATGRTATMGGGRSPNWQLVDLMIEPGRFYVDGILCELSKPISYASQPGVSGELPTSGLYRAYLEIWEESVSPVEDPLLREVALGGLDPSVRTRIATRVQLSKVDERDGDDDDPMAPERGQPGQLMAEHTGQSVPGNHLYRVEIHESGGLGGDNPATFKWSRDNGASLFAVAPVDSPNVVGLLYAAAGVPPLAVDDVVEPLAAGASLDGPAHPLLRVVDVSGADGQITLDQAPPDGTSLLRRWDNRAHGTTVEAVAGAELPVEGDWMGLEDGIRVRFQGEDFRRGDYWWIVARMDLAESIDWPHQSGHPQALPPDGPERLRTPLARLSLLNGEIEIEDLRRMTSPALASGSASRTWSSEAQPRRHPEPAARAEPRPEAEREAEREARPIDVEEEPVVEIDVDVLAEFEDDEGVETEPSTATESALPEPPPVDTTGMEGADEPGVEIDLNAASRIEEEGGPGGPTEPSGEPSEPSEPFVPFEPSEPSEPEPRQPESREPEPEGGWFHIGDLEVLGGRLLSAADALDSIVVATDRALFTLKLPGGEANELGSLPGTRQGSALVALGRLLLLVGGGHEAVRADGRLFAFDLEAGEWAERAPIPVRHAHPAVTVASGRVHAVGGRTRVMRQRVHGAHHIYDPGSDRWSAAPELPTPRSGAAAAALGGRVHVVGGHGHNNAPHVAHESFDVDRGTWRAEPALPEPRHIVSSATHRGRHVIVLGGSEAHAHHPAGHIVSFDPGSGSWEWLPPIPANLRDPRIVSHNGHLYVFGTRGDGHVELHELR